MSERNYIERQAAEARKKAIQGAAADALDEIRTTVLKLLMLTGIEDDTATVRRAMDHLWRETFPKPQNIVHVGWRDSQRPG